MLTQQLAAPEQHTLPRAAICALRDGLATCLSTRGLSHEARTAIADLCRMARNQGWAPEHLLVAVKEACHSSDEIGRLTTTSEREAMVSRIVTGCIQEFFDIDDAHRVR